MITEAQAKTALQASNLAYSYDQNRNVPTGFTWVNEYNDSASGFHAVVSKNAATGEYVVAFAGTEIRGTDALADLHLGTTQWSSLEAQRLRADLKDIGELSSTASIQFTGHSLGGALAEYAAYDFRGQNSDLSIGLITFNGLGGVEGLTQSGGYDATRLAGVDNAHFVAKGDVISAISEHVGENTYVLDFGPLFPLFAHQLDQTFLAPGNATLPLTGGSVTALDYLHMTNGQLIAAAFSNLIIGNPNPNSEAEATYRAAAGLLFALNNAPADEVARLVGAVFPGLTGVDWTAAVVFARATPLGTGATVFAMEAAFIGATLHGLEAARTGAQALTTDAIEGIANGYKETVRIADAGIEATVNAADAAQQAAVNGYLDTVKKAGDGIELLVGTYDQAVAGAADEIEKTVAFYGEVVVWTADRYADVAKLYGATEDAAAALGAWVKAEGERVATSGLDTLKQYVGESLSRLERIAAGPGLVFNGLTTMEALRGFFAAAEGSTFMSPIMLDLDGIGVNTTSLSNSGAFFDLDANGFAENAGWVSTGDGLLVFDLNNNGRIDSGRELFGNTTLLANGQTAANGFEALSEFDTNSDGTVDASDSSFADLKVWKDTNGDGFSTPDELITLADAGVRSIGVGYTDSTFVDSSGNQHRQVGSFTRADGTSGDAVDVWVNRNLIDTVAEDWVVVPADVAALPDLQGYGNVRNLHQAMVRDDTGQLKAFVETFSNETNEADRRATLEQILFKWTDAGNSTYSPGGTGMTESRLVVLERFFGETYSNVFQGRFLGLTADYSLLQAYQGVKELFYSQLMAQTHLKDAFDAITNQWDSASQSLKLDVSGAAQLFGALYAQDPEAARRRRAEFVQAIDGMQMRGQLPSDGSLHGTDGNDILIALPDLAQTLNGGAGSDTLIGHNEADTYVFNLGDGADTIVENGKNPDSWWDLSYAQPDKVVFGAGIAATDLSGSRVGRDLVIQVANSGGGQNANDELTIRNWYAGPWYAIEPFQLADGTPLDTSIFPPLDSGSEGDDYVVGGTSGDTLVALGGNDVIFDYGGNNTIDAGAGDDLIALLNSSSNVIQAGTGNDTIKSGSGNDTLYGGAGDDVITDAGGTNRIEGGAGNDQLTGGNGSDTYAFNRGDGQDRISDYSGYATYPYGYWWLPVWLDTGAEDTVQFGSGTAAGDVQASRDGADLVVRINDAANPQADDGLRITGWYSDPLRRVEHFEFADGTSLTRAQIQQMATVVTGTAGDDVLVGSDENNTIYGLEGNDAITDLSGNNVIDGGAGNDTITAGTGNDTLYGGAGDDTITDTGGTNRFEGGAGSDQLTGGNGSDTYAFNRADGQDRISDFSGYATYPYGYGWGPVWSDTGAQDTVQFGSEIAAGDVQASRDGSDLVVRVNDAANPQADDGLRIAGWYSDPLRRVEHFEFADGTSLTGAQIQQMATVVTGTTGDDVLTGWEENNTINGLEGNDTITDLSGNNVIGGGAGNDQLTGGNGSDTYVFNRGDGQDTISDYSGQITWPAWWLPVWADTGAQDTVRFGSGIAAGDVQASRDGSDLVVRVNDAANPQADDGLRIAGWYSDSWRRVEHFAFADGTSLTGAQVQQMATVVTGTAGDDVLAGWDESNTINGLEGNDTLTDASGNNVIDGGAGNDTITAGAGNDTLYGGTGNDTITDAGGTNLIEGGSGNDQLTGGNGSDTYVFNRGDGQDTISDYSGYVTYPYGYWWMPVWVDTGAQDMAQFGSEIAAGDVQASRDGSDLVVRVNDAANPQAQDGLRIAGWYSDSLRRVEHFEFADGTSLTGAQVQQLATVVTGTAGDDVLTGWEENNTLYGLEGNDAITDASGNNVIDGGAGNDTITAGTGNDTLYGGAGDDAITDTGGTNRIEGGAGSDQLTGGNGSDTYAFNRGDGQDTISDYSGYVTYPYGYWWMPVWVDTGAQDMAQFGSGIAAGDVQASRDGSDLVVRVNDAANPQADDGLRIAGWYSDPLRRVEHFEFADGTIWNAAALQDHVNRAPVLGTTIMGQTATEDAVFGFAIPAGTFTDADAGDTLAYAASLEDGSPLPGWLTFDAASRTFSGTPVQADVGALDIQVTATDQGGLSAQDAFTLNVVNVNDAPTLANAIGDQTAAEDGAFNYQISADTFTDEDAGDTLSYSATQANGAPLPAWLSFGAASRTFSGMPLNADVGTFNLKVTATDSGNLSVSDNFDITVSNTNDAPVVAHAPGEHFVQAGSPFAFALDANAFADPDGDALVYAAIQYNGTPLPSWLSFSAATRTFSGTPRSADVGAWPVAVSATDPHGAAASAAFNLAVQSQSGATVKGNRNDNVLYGNGDNETIKGRDGNDALFGLAGDDILRGGDGNDLLQGGSGADVLRAGEGQNLLDGGSGDDLIYGGKGAALIAGGTGNDVIRTGKGKDVIAFNRGDGSDLLYADGKGDNTLSFGGGIGYDDLSLVRQGKDLIVNAGQGERVVLKNWYNGHDSVLNLQIILDATASFDANSSDPLLNHRVQTFDFGAMVKAFDHARSQNPGLSNWQMTNALLQFHLNGSDDAAIGGDLAYWYGRNNSFAGISIAAAQAVIGAAGFGQDAQNLRPFSGLQEGLARLA